MRLSGMTIRIGAVSAALAAVIGSAAAAVHAADATPPRYAAPRPAQTAAGPQPATFIGSATVGGPSRLAMYAAANGSRLRFLTAPEPGGGAGGPALSANGRTVAFARALGTCAQAIDTVPARGGKERTLIPLIGSGIRWRLPDDPSYSSDGRYLLYVTAWCQPPVRPLVHLRTLSTGRELTASNARHRMFAAAVLVNSDRQFAYVTQRGMLAVRQVPSFATTIHAPARGCRYQRLAGTESRLVALLQCGPRRRLSVVAVSVRTFAVTRTLARLGPCLDGTSLSLAIRDPGAILAETMDACGSLRGARSHILIERAGSVTQVRSGLWTRMPQEVIW